MAIAVSAVQERMLRFEKELRERVRRAQAEGRIEEAAEIARKLEMVEGETRKLAPQNPFGVVQVWKEGERYVSDDFGDATGYGVLDVLRMPTNQRAAMEKKKQAEEILRRKNLLAAPHNACSLSVAVDLWTVKFGDGWVRCNDMPNAPKEDGAMNWNALMTRLDKVGKIEKLEDYVRIVS